MEFSFNYIVLTTRLKYVDFNNIIPSLLFWELQEIKNEFSHFELKNIVTIYDSYFVSSERLRDSESLSE